jgi:hypothetical protein
MSSAVKLKLVDILERVDQCILAPGGISFDQVACLFFSFGLLLPSNPAT